MLSAVYAISLIGGSPPLHARGHALQCNPTNARSSLRPDRTNISIARTVGMGRDLQLTVGERYS